MKKKKKTRRGINFISSLVLIIIASSLFADFVSDSIYSILLPFFTEIQKNPKTVSPAPNLILYIFLFLYIRWIYPLYRYFSAADDRYLEKARKRISSLTRYTLLWIIGQTVANLTWTIVFERLYLLQFNELFFYFLFPITVHLIYCSFFIVLLLDSLLFSKLIPRLYTDHTLYEKKSGFSLSIRLKLTGTLSFLVIIPFIMIFLWLYQTGHYQSLTQLIFDKEKSSVTSIILCSLFFNIVFIEILYRNINTPLARLAKKMKLVSDGDFSVKTTVLSNDEIGKVKAYFNEMVKGLAERERIKDTFGRFVSIEIARQLMESGNIKLGGEAIEATVLFSDIRDFTTLSEKMSAEEVVHYLNEYFSYITHPIMEYNGVINKFIGDAVMAVFAPQLGSLNHADDALKAARGMKKQLDSFNSSEKFSFKTGFGIGIHTGTLVAGNIGTEKRLEYTVIGDTVNIASRIESENKKHSSEILISSETYDQLSAEFRAEFSYAKIENVLVKGKEKPLTLYKILS